MLNLRQNQVKRFLPFDQQPKQRLTLGGVYLRLWEPPIVKSSLSFVDETHRLRHRRIAEESHRLKLSIQIAVILPRAEPSIETSPFSFLDKRRRRRGVDERRATESQRKRPSRRRDGETEREKRKKMKRRRVSTVALYNYCVTRARNIRYHSAPN